MPISPKTRAENTLQTGVYCWCNRINGKVYVGQAAKSFKQRKNDHIRRLRQGKSKHKHLQSAWNKYGEDMFEWMELWKCLPEECNDWEQWWMDRLHSADPNHGYNLAPVAGSPLRCRHTDETKAKMSLAMKRVQNDPEVRAKWSATIKNTLANPVHKAKMSLASKKSLADPDVKAKMSVAMKNRMADSKFRAKLCKLTDKQVVEIRRRYLKRNERRDNGKALAEEFGVSAQLIRRIAARECWKHMPERIDCANI